MKPYLMFHRIISGMKIFRGTTGDLVQKNFIELQAWPLYTNYFEMPSCGICI